MQISLELPSSVFGISTIRSALYFESVPSPRMSVLRILEHICCYSKNCSIVPATDCTSSAIFTQQLRHQLLVQRRSSRFIFLRAQSRPAVRKVPQWLNVKCSQTRPHNMAAARSDPRALLCLIEYVQHNALLGEVTPSPYIRDFVAALLHEQELCAACRNSKFRPYDRGSAKRFSARDCRIFKHI